MIDISIKLTEFSNKDVKDHCPAWHPVDSDGLKNTIRQGTNPPFNIPHVLEKMSE